MSEFQTSHLDLPDGAGSPVREPRQSMPGVSSGSTAGVVPEPTQPIDMESLERIWEARMRQAVEDPVAYSKSLGELSMYPELWDTSAEEARELWDD